MKAADLEQMAAAVEKGFQKSVKTELEDPTNGIIGITLPFTSRAGAPFYIFAFRVAGSLKMQLSDGGALTKELKKAGDLQLQAVQRLVNSYGLSLMEDLSVMETSNRSLPKRVMSFLQAQVAVDGMLRAWDAMKERS